jgi:hypothetical protein
MVHCEAPQRLTDSLACVDEGSAVPRSRRRIAPDRPDGLLWALCRHARIRFAAADRSMRSFYSAGHPRVPIEPQSPANGRGMFWFPLLQVTKSKMPVLDTHSQRTDHYSMQSALVLRTFLLRLLEGGGYNRKL